MSYQSLLDILTPKLDDGFLVGTPSTSHTPTLSEETITSLKDDDPPREKKPNKKKKPIAKRNPAAKTASEWAVRGRENCERLRELRVAVQKAIEDHKIFTVVGVYPALRNALKRRGWFEKRGTVRPKKPKKTVPGSNSSIPSDSNVSGRRPLSTRSKGSTAKSAPVTVPYDDNSDEMLIARLLRDAPPADFLWTMRDSIEWSNLNKYQIVNRFQRAYFNTKVGLCSYMQQMHWYCEVGVSDINFPRCYTIGLGDELAAFKYDFRITACLSLLKWLVSSYEEGGEQAVQSVEGRVPMRVVDFAVDRSNDYISTHIHEDIDRKDYQQISDYEWNGFLNCYYLIVHGQTILDKTTTTTSIQTIYETSKCTVANVKKHWPQLAVDGIFNIWIVKPGNKSRGRGIKLMGRLKDILARANPNMPKESRFVVQKYIERPLLIHNTKFDIRQWFLVTCADPLTIWMYKESYLRFSSQPFSLVNMHESIHLCNNAVQKKYKNGKRDNKELPKENMWDSNKFKEYLSSIGKADVWDKRIYPGMKEGIIGTLLASQEHMGTCRNCFELFGADFMITEDFGTWLIEINSCPDLSSSTSVTARLCPQCLEDVIKVVVDRRNNRSASTGLFEMVYKQQVPRAAPQLGIGLSLAIRGKGILIDKLRQKKLCRQMSIASARHHINSHSETKYRIKKYSGPIIEDILDGLACNLDKAVVDYEEECSDDVEKQGKLRNQKSAVPIAKKKQKKGTSRKRALKKNKKTKESPVKQESTEDNIEEDSSNDNETSDSSATLRSNDQLQCKENMAPASLTNHQLSLLNWNGNRLVNIIENSIPLSFEELLSKRICAQVTTTQIKTPGEINAYREMLCHITQTKDSCQVFLDSLNNMLEQSNGIKVKNKYLPIEAIKEDKESDETKSNKPAIRKIVEKLARSQPEREFFVNTKDQGFVGAFSGSDNHEE